MQLTSRQQEDFVIFYVQHYWTEICLLAAQCGVDHKLYDEEYLAKFTPDIYSHLLNLCITENKWVKTLSRTLTEPIPTTDQEEHKRFIYWFMRHTYRIDMDTTMEGLRSRLREEYHFIVKSLY